MPLPPLLFPRHVVALSLGLMLPLAPAAAVPFTPSEDTVVVERLRSDANADAELRRLRTALARNPQDAPLAATLAQRYIERARAPTPTRATWAMRRRPSRPGGTRRWRRRR